jgi:uncharacterized protein YbjT (DUF2867 family)
VGALSARTALLLGGSGLVGGFCLRALLEEDAYGRVISLGRRSLATEHPKLTQVVARFERPESFAEAARSDDVFSCLGTTSRKTPSRADYRRIDFDIPLAVARLALKRGAKRLMLVSSAGADARSPFFYPRLKGELDEAVSALGFEAVHIMRPSFLLGVRGESRPGEAAALALLPPLSPLFIGPLRRYRPISAETVGRAIVRAALGTRTGAMIHEFDSIEALGAQR